METSLAQIVSNAAGRPEVRQAVHRIYAEVQGQVDARRPLCVMSGRCCRFEEFGHRLYVTSLELAAFFADLQAMTPPPSSQTAAGGCPFQVNTLCSVHLIRPFGCRMFFCDATSTEWQNQFYEQFHDRLKSLHAELGIPYRYVEWRQALAELGLMPGG